MPTKLNYHTIIKNSKFLEIEELESLDFQIIEVKKLKRPNYSNRIPIDGKLHVLSNSLTSNGFIGGILVAKSTLSVIDGWQRLQFWEAMGNETIPCFVVECSFLREKQLHLSFNQQVSEFDLQQFGLSFAEIDLKDFGFDEIDYINPNVMAEIEKEQEHQFDKRAERVKNPTIPCTVAIVKKIDSIKTEQQLQTRKDVLNLLIENYESNKD